MQSPGSCRVLLLQPGTSAAQPLQHRLCPYRFQILPVIPCVCTELAPESPGMLRVLFRGLQRANQHICSLFSSLPAVFTLYFSLNMLILLEFLYKLQREALEWELGG